MCGIIGYIGECQAAPILIEGLERLEYRGYDSSGLAVRDGREVQVVKSTGRLKRLAEITDNGKALYGFCGLGHTRWATHGEPSEVNSHPHQSSDGEVTLVHNGIIENYAEQRKKLMARGYSFVSETDTEVAASMLSYYYKKYGREPLRAISETMLRIHGSFAFGIMFKDCPEVLYAARGDSPLIIGRAEDGYYLASDVPAILSHTRLVYYPDNMEIAEIKRDGVRFFNSDLEQIKRDCVEIMWDNSYAHRGEYEHFMLKEIHEQPKAVRETLSRYIKNGEIDLSQSGLTDGVMRELDRLYIVACGSAYHVAEVAKYEIERVAGLPVETEIASEFRYRERELSKNGAVIVISQSGETADTLAALRISRQRGLRAYAIVNVAGSTISREADGVIYTQAGQEVSVATTKAYSAQLAAVYMLCIRLAAVRGRISRRVYDGYIDELTSLPKKIGKCLENQDKMRWLAQSLSGTEDAFFIGRGLDYALALEGSLKLKEITYIHSEAYAAGELKHGSISLIEDGTLVICLMTQEELVSKTVSNISEVKSRGACVITIAADGERAADKVSDEVLYVPKTDRMLMPSLAVIPLQILAYYLSVARGHDVDKPRNLAKSVTVE